MNDNNFKVGDIVEAVTINDFLKSWKVKKGDIFKVIGIEYSQIRIAKLNPEDKFNLYGTAYRFITPIANKFKLYTYSDNTKFLLKRRL